MKKLLYSLCTFLMLSASVYAQSPKAVNYQAVARDKNGALLASSKLSIRLTVHSGSASGKSVYTETFKDVSTNAYGMFTLQIGTGTTSGNFGNIDWTSANMFLQVEADPANGTSYGNLGTTQLVSVPYAFNADKVSKIDNHNLSDLSDVKGSPAKGQVLKYNGTNWVPANDSVGTGGGSGSSGWTVSGTNLYTTGYSVGIGTSTPATPFMLNATSLTSSQDAGAVFSVKSRSTDTTTAIGVLITAQSGSASSRGITALASGATTGENIGILGLGGASSGTNIGIEGISQGAGTFNAGGFFAAVRPFSSSLYDNDGISAHAGGSTHFNFGVYSRSSAEGKQNTGVAGLSLDTNASAINVGILGSATKGATNYGVYGGAPITKNSYAGFFNGNLAYLGSLISASDEKLKTNIQSMPSVLGKLKLLTPKMYDFRTGDPAFKGMNLATGKQFGFIAQNLGSVFPELVHQTTFSEPGLNTAVQNGKKSATPAKAEEQNRVEFNGVNYIGMVPVLTQAIKEQQDLIEAQKAQIDALSKRLEALEQKLR